MARAVFGRCETALVSQQRLLRLLQPPTDARTKAANVSEGRSITSTVMERDVQLKSTKEYFHSFPLQGRCDQRVECKRPIEERLPVSGSHRYCCSKGGDAKQY